MLIDDYTEIYYFQNVYSGSIITKRGNRPTINVLFPIQYTTFL